MKRSDLSAPLDLYASTDDAQWTPGNSITPLVNGESAYPEMIASISRARISISLATYQFDNDVVGAQFCKALSEAVGRGVKVRVLIDTLGALLYRPPIFFRLRKTEITARYFTWPAGRIGSLLKRYHRKLLVVDGRLSFAGGMNIRRSHLINSGHPKTNQDVHFQIEGPVVSAIQRLFADDWFRVAGESLTGEDWFPPLEHKGSVTIRLLASGLETDRRIESVFCAAIRSASRRIDVVTPYFLPSDVLSVALTDAMKRNVLVRLFVPRENFAIVKWASHRHIKQMLEFGCQVRAVPPPFDHSKLLTIDDSRSLVGSVNWDPRSFFLNAELIVDVQDVGFTAQIAKLINDKEHLAEPMTLARLRDIPFLSRFLGKLFESQL